VPDHPTPSPEVVICATCGVEHADRPDVCAICDDERQWVPADGQRWTTLGELADSGHHVRVESLEPSVLSVTAEPKVGIGHTGFLVTTDSGSLLWDPPGYLDEEAVERVCAGGEVMAIATSHPHMFGAQVEWSRALGGVPILVCEPLREWVARPDPAMETWRERHEIAPGLTLVELGGHFAGSSVAHWAAGADGRGVLLSSDTIHANPDRETVTFLRSYPNRIPLSPAVAQRVASGAAELGFDRLYDNFARVIDGDAADKVLRSAERYARWAAGEHDDLT
jgi:hypothetical protein